MKEFFVFIVLFLLLSETLTSESENSLENDYTDYNENIYKKYVEIDKQLKKFADQSVKRILPNLLEARGNVNISASCSQNVFQMVTGFRKLKKWTFQLFDAMGKLQSGLLAGNLQMFGEYDECVETIVSKNGKVDFQGQYCLLSVKPYLPKVKRIPGIYGRLEGLMNATRNSSEVWKDFLSQIHGFYTFTVNVGICTPSGCSKEDISSMITYTVGDYINATVSKCFKKGDLYFWTTQRTAMVILYIILGMIVIVSTWLDNTLETWKTDKLGLKSRILQCFSLTRNFKKLMKTDVSEKTVTCLNGIRVLTIFWIILGNQYFVHATTMTANHFTISFQKKILNFFSQIIVNGFLSVEMFFFISGFLNCYSRIRKKQDGSSQRGFLMNIIHRLWRIYPAYSIAFSILPLMYKTQPYMYNFQKNFRNSCELYWWRNILFIGNFFSPFDMCMTHTWFLCVDMQLFLVALLTIPVLLRTPKKGVILHVNIIIIVNICSMTWWFLSDLPPSTLDMTSIDWSPSLRGYNLNALPTLHIGPYFIGILLGYKIATMKEIKIPKIIQIFGWFAASLLFVSMLFLTLKWNYGIPYTKLESALYGTWSRTLIVLGFSWLVFCCATGHARLINYILSLKLWIPLSRISFMLFLVSPILQTHFYFHLNFPDDFSDMNLIRVYFGDLFISILLSFTLVLIAESPLLAMEKIFFKRNQYGSKTFVVSNELTSNSKNENGLHENGKFAIVNF